MKLKALLLFFATIALLSCSKDTTIVDTGTIRYTNLSSGANRYTIFLDGKNLGLLNSNTNFDKADVPVGSHIVKAVQYEGYVLFPTEVENTVSITKGVTLQFQFP